jgi:hypothetical protein
MKKVPFNYESWKANPQTKLVTRNGREAVTLGENPYNKEYPLIGYINSVESWTKNGIYKSIGDESPYDLFMLQEVEEVVRYTNVSNSILGYFRKTKEEVIQISNRNDISVAKIVIIDGIIDFSKCETVHTY